MDRIWIWKCPICKIRSKITFHASGRARRSGRVHLKNMHNDYETEPEIIKVL